MLRGQYLAGTRLWVQLSVKERRKEACNHNMLSRILLGSVLCTEPRPVRSTDGVYSILLGSALLCTGLTLQIITDISESCGSYCETVDPHSVFQLQLTLDISTYKSKSLGGFPQLVITPQVGSRDIQSENKVGTIFLTGLIYSIALYKYHLVTNKSSFNKMLFMGKLGHLIYLQPKS